MRAIFRQLHRIVYKYVVDGFRREAAAESAANDASLMEALTFIRKVSCSADDDVLSVAIPYSLTWLRVLSYICK